MALTAATVLDHARDFHPAFSPTRSPDAVGRRALTRYQQALARRLIGAGQTAALGLVDGEVALPLDDPSTGIDLPTVFGGDVLHVAEVVATPSPATDAADRVPVTLVGLASRFRAPGAPAAALDGTTLRLVGTADDWAGYTAVTVRAAVLPDDLATNSAALAVPADALEACAAAVAAFWAQRLEGIDGLAIDALAFDARRQNAENALVDRLTRQSVGQPMRIRRVW